MKTNQDFPWKVGDPGFFDRGSLFALGQVPKSEQTGRFDLLGPYLLCFGGKGYPP